MPNPSAQTIWKLDAALLETLLNSVNLKPLSKKIRFYAPSFNYYKTKHFCSSTKEFPIISITGNSCSLNCKHCGGVVLQTMHPALTPQNLFELGMKLKAEGARGVLISGGCLPDGSMPIEEFLPVFAQLKRELDLSVFVHTGIIGENVAVGLKEAGVDAALIDVIGSQETLQKALNLNVGVADYGDSLHALTEAKLNVVPHVIVGLNDGKLDGELQALQTIAANSKPAAVVIIAFMPLHGTVMAKTPPPKPLDIAKVSATARIMFPDVPLLLGCMRPKGKTRGITDVLALKTGVDGIAFPSDEAVEYAKSKGLESSFSSYCCAQLYLDYVK